MAFRSKNWTLTDRNGNDVLNQEGRKVTTANILCLNCNNTFPTYEAKTAHFTNCADNANR